METINLNKLLDDMGVYDVSLDKIDIPDVPMFTDISLAVYDLNFIDFTDDNTSDISGSGDRDV